MMSQDMMTQHQKMMTRHQEMANLIDQLLKSVSTLESEKDPVLLKKELAEHAALVKELQNKFRQNSAMMEMGRMGEHSMMMQHGEKAMGFSQTQTTHHFFLRKDGGVIQVETNDPKDTQNRDLIRTHLAHIAQAFAAGDFSNPLAVHDKVPDGVPVMQRLKGDIRYAFEQTPQGGRVVISTANLQALDAIHQFLRFQVSEHQTGDSLIPQ
jgi:predicted RNase H-like nuclease (RuvC/YqgF family)